MSILSYTVKAGDTLSQIARDQETTVAAFMAANPEITDPDNIQIGQVLILPSGAKGYKIFEGVEGYETGMGVHMVEISEGADGTQWGIGQDARVYKKENGSWKQNPSGMAAHIVVLNTNNVYVSNSNGEVYKLKGSAYNSAWEKDQDARNVMSLRRSPDGTMIEVTNEQGDLYQLENGKWKLLFSERHPGADQPVSPLTAERETGWIQFAPGATSATYSRSLPSGHGVRYFFRAAAGQTVTIDFAPAGLLTVFLMAADGSYFENGDGRLEAMLLEAGEHTLDVAATNAENGVQYQFTITIE
jgi:LysM repeat protein